MSSQTTDMWEKEFDEKFEWFIKLGESQLETSDTPDIKAFISQALQAAKEEERNRIVLEIEEKMKTRGRYYLKTVENGGLYNEGLEDATAIVNKHQ